MVIVILGLLDQFIEHYYLISQIVTALRQVKDVLLTLTSRFVDNAKSEARTNLMKQN